MAYTDFETMHDGRDDGPMIAERIWFGVLSVIAAAVLASSVITIAAGFPQTCLTCHGDQAASLGKSAHAGVACSDCHGGTTTAGVIQSRLRVVDMVAHQLVGGTASVGQPVDEQRCMACHSRQSLSKTIEKNELRMNHRAPIEKGVACITCHPGSGHAGTTAKGRFGYSMDSCMACHSSNPKDIKGCAVCHIDAAGGSSESQKPSPWRVTHGPNWRKTHGMGDLRTCAGCHRSGFCVKCHNVPVPHQDGYLGDHGPVAKALGAEGREGCMTCHNQHSCENCHGMEMPHPSGFLKGHSKLARQSEGPCMRCHTKGSCEGCHVKHTHPGLPEDLKKKLLGRPVSGR